MELAKRTITLVDPQDQEVVIQAEIAETDAQRQRGLMFRDYLDSDAGMLFIFDQPQELSFWMKNTLIPLDILYFDAEGNLVSSTTMTPCTSDPCPGYRSGGEATYALEVNAGYVEKHGINADWIMQISG